jgi:hypothetical protein
MILAPTFNPSVFYALPCPSQTDYCLNPLSVVGEGVNNTKRNCVPLILFAAPIQIHLCSSLKREDEV